jgi:hypothetical protein
MTRPKKSNLTMLGNRKAKEKDEPILEVLRPQPNKAQRIALAWVDYAAFNNLMPSQKKYKLAQHAFLVGIAEQLGNDMPPAIMICMMSGRDVATLLQGKQTEE